MTAADAWNDFVEDIETLVEEYGEDPVYQAVEKLVEEDETLETKWQNRGMPIKEGLTGKIGTKLVQWAHKLVPSADNIAGAAAKGGKKGRTAATLATGGILSGIGGAAAAAVGKTWDQDVDIAAISTDDALNIKSPDIEKLLAQNFQAIEKMSQILTQTQQDLSKKLGDVDKSIDYMATGEDENVDQVSARQDLGLSKKKSKKAGDKKLEKKAKDLASNKKAMNVSSGEAPVN